ncbi:MAG: bifunctional methylenetetrahydrofolate dehydrogenase/methenyltetrahydrofolate cyclohydrolase [Acidimicrobiia bacterium]|nr:bifunctional methylenetetrahydrofolate dehydrogenase/methenyltetrahydrofolate cyclohydrolase [Acidimicrobiia bacterium]MBP8180772.1 bifunctional methylenetetrahydrofolate dehydrogenase/methenyltetrahydrofolate cyclohydrolase [Acidimicrobiia bacterium]
MSAQRLDGWAAANAIRAELAESVAELKAQGVVPGLATVLIGDDPASHVYVSNKHTACGEIGIKSLRVDLPGDTTREQALDTIAALNADPEVHSYLIQYPVPGHLDFNELLYQVDPAKDGDGLHPFNLGMLALGADGPRPCTPVGIQALLAHHGVRIEGATVAIVGRGLTVGRPLAILLTLKEPQANATVVQCHTGTPDIGEFTRQADIVVAAVGRAGTITADMIKPGAAVVDVGVNRVDDKLVGDVDPAVAEVAGWLSPVPGGVGPMTITMLMKNTVAAAQRAVAER